MSRGERVGSETRNSIKEERFVRWCSSGSSNSNSVVIVGGWWWLDEETKRQADRR